MDPSRRVSPRMVGSFPPLIPLFAPSPPSMSVCACRSVTKSTLLAPASTGSSGIATYPFPLTFCLSPAVVSPMRQNAMRGAFKHLVFQGYARTLAQAPYFLVPIALGSSPLPASLVLMWTDKMMIHCPGYACLKWAIADNHLRNSKEGHIQGKLYDLASPLLCSTSHCADSPLSVSPVSTLQCVNFDVIVSVLARDEMIPALWQSFFPR